MNDRRPASLGIIGAGRVGMVLARLASSAGYRVRIAGSGDPSRLGVDTIAGSVSAAWAVDVARESDAVILAIPLGRYRELPVAHLQGRLVIDAMNHWWELDGLRPDLADLRTSTSETVQRFLGSARVVKAFNHMSASELEEQARSAGAPDRKAIAVAGDDPADVAAAAGIVDDLGFDPVVAGPLAAGVMLEPGSDVFGAAASAEDLRELLAGFATSQRGILVARARGGTLPSPW